MSNLSIRPRLRLAEADDTGLSIPRELSIEAGDYLPQGRNVLLLHLEAHQKADVLIGEDT
jgi:hypothetical protein